MLKKLRQLFIGETFAWNLSISPKEVEKILSEKDLGIYFNSSAGITVIVKNRKFSFYKITIGNIPMSYNHMAHMLVGYIEESSNGSRVSARFQLPFFITLLFIFLLIIPLFGSIIAMIIAIKNYQLSKNLLFIFFSLAVFLTMGFLRKMAAKDEHKIISFFKDSLDKYKTN